MKEVVAAVAVAVAWTVAEGGDVAAFYLFNERAAGESAVGVPITNAADSASHMGSATVVDGGAIVYDDDVPGQYLFSGFGESAVQVGAHPRSLKISGSSYAANKSGDLSFADISDVLSESEDSEYTIEFFVKIDPGCSNLSYQTVFSFDSGFRMDGATFESSKGILSTDMNLLFCTGKPDQFRFGMGSGGASARFGIANFSQFVNYRWQHMAFVHSNKTWWVHLNYSTGKIGNKACTYGGKVTGLPLQFGRNNFQCKISGLRVTKKALPVSQLLYASDYPGYFPDTVFHWLLNGDAGTNVGVISNNAPRGLEVIGSSGTNQVSSIINTLKIGTINLASMTGDGNGHASTNNVWPVYAARQKIKAVCDGEEVLGESSSSVYLEIRHRDSASDTFGSGPDLRIDHTAYVPYTGSFTMECLSKFDAVAWTNEVINAGIAGGRLRTSLFGYAVGTDNYRWMLQYYQNTRKLQLTCNVTTNGVSGKDIPVASASSEVKIEDGRWHHYAVTFDVDKQEFVGYLDYVPVVTNRPPEGTKYYRSATAKHFVGNWLSGHPYPGWFDQVRVTRRVLPPSRFLRLKRPPVGMLLLVR